MTGTRIPALLTGVTAAFVLTACGVPPSGVIEAGVPATRMNAPLYVYFLAGDRLVTVPRKIPGGPDVAAAVREVFAGPTKAEAGKVSTELPRLTKPPEVTAGNGDIHIRLPDGVAPLGPLAQRQLMCTVTGIRYGQPPLWWVVPPSADTDGSATKDPGAVRVSRIVLVSDSTWKMFLAPGACDAQTAPGSR